MSKDKSGHAFPVDERKFCKQGMTLRQWYAGQALNGILSSGTGVSGNDKGHHYEPEIIADSCFKYADAMIKEGNK